MAGDAARSERGRVAETSSTTAQWRAGGRTSRREVALVLPVNKLVHPRMLPTVFFGVGSSEPNKISAGELARATIATRPR